VLPRKIVYVLCKGVAWGSVVVKALRY
jgi:hypothetical protein